MSLSSDDAPHQPLAVTEGVAGRRLPPASFAERAGLALLAIWRKVDTDQASLHAMSLTYTTILSMVPLLAVTFSMLKAFGVQGQIEPLLAQSLAPLGAVEGVTLSRRIVEFVNRMQVGVLGAVGVAGLFYTVVALVGSIENALNKIWRARRGRDWTTKFRDYLSVIIVGPVLVFSALALIASAQQHSSVQKALALAPWLVWLGTEIIPFVILAVAFTLLYRFVPNTWVTWRAAAAGGIAAGSAWKFAGTAFTQFVASSGRYTAIYSSFAILVLFFIWIYVSWMIVLIGAELAYFFQHPRQVLRGASDRSTSAHERGALAMLVLLARAHLEGLPPIDTTTLADQSQLGVSETESLVETLISKGILLRSQEPSGIAIALPPGKIPIARVLEILRGGDEADGLEYPDTISTLMAKRAAAVEHALSGTTLQSLARPESAE